MNISQETKYQRQIEWRREKVLELASDGYGVREIARLLEISHPTVSRDMQWLRYQAKEQIRKYIDEQVPLEYHKTLTGLQNIIKSMSDIISKSSDNREIMQASGIKIQALNMKMELVSNANLVHEAIDLVERYRGYTNQKAKVSTDVLNNLRKTVEYYKQQLSSTTNADTQKLELLKGLPFYCDWIRNRIIPRPKNGLCLLFQSCHWPTQKDGNEYPLFDYELQLFNALTNHKYVWVKKASGLGITEFVLRFMAWLATRNDTYRLALRAFKEQSALQ